MAKGDFFEAVISDFHSRLDDFLLDVRESERTMVDESFESESFTKSPIDTKLLKDSTYITKGTKKGLVKTTLDLKISNKKRRYEKRKINVTTDDTAELVTYGLGSHAKFGKRDYQKLIEKKIYEKLKYALTK